MGAVIHVTSLKAMDVESLSGYLSSDGSSAVAVCPRVVCLSILSCILTSAIKKTFWDLKIGS